MVRSGRRVRGEICRFPASRVLLGKRGDSCCRLVGDLRCGRYGRTLVEVGPEVGVAGIRGVVSSVSRVSGVEGEFCGRVLLMQCRGVVRGPFRGLANSE